MITAAECQEKTVEVLAIEWLEIAEGRAVTGNASTFLKFMAAWIAFTTLYDTGDQESPDERDLWKKYIDDNRYLEERHRGLLKSANTEYVNACGILKQGVYREGYINFNDKTIVTDKDFPTYLVEPDRLDNLMLTIYAIRVNLFHGCSKSPKNHNDHEKVNAAYTVLYNVIEEVAVTNSNEITRLWFDVAGTSSVTRSSLRLRFSAAWIAFSAFCMSDAVVEEGIERKKDSWVDSHGKEVSEKDLRKKFIFGNGLNGNHQENFYKDQEYREQSEVLVGKSKKAKDLCAVVEKIKGIRNLVFHGKGVGEEKIKAGVAVLMFLLNDVSRGWRDHYKIDQPDVQVS
jgi:hypothetical protein